MIITLFCSFLSTCIIWYSIPAIIILSWEVTSVEIPCALIVNFLSLALTKSLVSVVFIFSKKPFTVVSVVVSAIAPVDVL